MSYPHLIVPVENQVRELDAKLLFACVAAERGFPVVLGSRTFLNFKITEIPPGIFVAKSMRARSALMFNIMRDLGHEVVAWDEESLVRFDAPEYLPWRFSKASLAPISRIFAWGEDDADLFAELDLQIPIHVTGNPRVDLLRPDVRAYFRAAADDLRRRFGEFILVNTNFSFVNAFVSKLNLVQGEGATHVSRTGHGMPTEFAAGMAAHQQAIFDGFRTIMPKLRRWFPQHTVVLRPHPSEDHDVWRRVFRDQDDVHVLHEGNVVPWLLACRVLLHNGCTTAVEAAVLDVPTVSYRPVNAKSYDYHLPNGLSHEARCESEVRDLIAAILAGELSLSDSALRHRLFSRHLTAIDGPLASDRITQILEQSLCDGRPARRSIARYARARATATVRKLIKQINGRRRGHWNSAEYHDHRFPPISADAVRARVGAFSSVLERFGNIDVKSSAPGIFEISASRAAHREGLKAHAAT